MKRILCDRIGKILVVLPEIAAAAACSAVAHSPKSRSEAPSSLSSAKGSEVISGVLGEVGKLTVGKLTPQQDCPKLSKLPQKSQNINYLGQK